MRIHQPVLIKIPLLALLCLATVELSLPQFARAGRAPVTFPDSSGAGVSDTLSPFAPPADRAIAAQISQRLATALQTLQTEQLVLSVSNTTLPVSPAVMAALSAASINGTRSDAAALELLLSAEVGVPISVSIADTSPEELGAAIISINAVVTGLSREQLAAAISSPTFMSVLQLLKAANEAANGGGASQASAPALSIVQLSLK